MGGFLTQLGVMLELKLPVGSLVFDTVGSWSVVCPDTFVGSLVSGT